MATESEKIKLHRTAAFMLVGLSLLYILILLIYSPIVKNSEKNRCGCNFSTNCTGNTTVSNGGGDSNFWIDVFASKSSDDYWVLFSPDAELMSLENKNCFRCKNTKFYLNKTEIIEIYTFLKPCLIVDKCDISNWHLGQSIKPDCTVNVTMSLSGMHFCLNENHSLQYAQYGNFTLGMSTINIIFVSE